MANPTITINATGITVSGPLIAGEPVAVTASGLSLPEGAALTLALSSRAPNALLASCVLAESEETPGTWTGTLETASRQMAVYFATAAADDTRPAVLELVETTTRDSLALLVTSIRNSALIPSSSPCAVAPVYIPVPGPPGDTQTPSDTPPQMDGTAAAGTSDAYARGDHRHPTDTTRQEVIADLAAIRSGAAAGATAVQPADLATVATTGDYDDLTNKPTIPPAQIQSDWNQTNAEAVDFIKNKPTIPGPAPSPSTATPQMDGTGAAGTATTYARGDHRHPSDTEKVSKSGDTMTGALEAPLLRVQTGGGLVVETSNGNISFGANNSTPFVSATHGAFSEHFRFVNRAVPNGTVLDVAIMDNLAPAFSTSSTYAVGDYVTYEGLLYKCATAVSTAGEWDAANWSAVAVTDEMGSAIRYAFASPTPTVSGTSATVACEDRAINDFTIATGITSLTITPPAAMTGRARDFFCRVTLTDSSLPTVALSGGTIDIGASEVAGMTQGVNLLMFTEIASGHWLASRRSAS